MEEWKEYRLGEVISIAGGFTYKGNLIGKGHNYLLGMGCVSFNENFLDKGARQYDGDCPDRFYAYPGDIVLATRQQSDNLPILGMPAIIPSKYEGHKMIVGANLYRVDIKDKSFNNRFLYWLLKTPSYVNHIRSCQSGTTVRMITKANIEDYIFYAPDKTTRDHISDFIWALDDKIEVNRKINENLEQQAQALFKSWFVDFEPFKNGEFVESELGMIPKGWRVGTLGEYCKVRSGFAFKSTWWTNEGVPVIKIKNITDNGNLEMLDCSFVSKEHAALAKEFQTIEGDLLIAMTGATIGKYCIVHDNSKYCVNQRVGKFFLGNEPLKKLPFIFLNLKQSSVHDEIINRGQGSAQPNISGGDIETLKVVIAPDVVISNFNVMLYPSFKKMISNQQESRRLSELRDTLLPKLMSGELKVNEIEK